MYPILIPKFLMLRDTKTFPYAIKISSFCSISSHQINPKTTQNLTYPVQHTFHKTESISHATGAPFFALFAALGSRNGPSPYATRQTKYPVCILMLSFAFFKKQIQNNLCLCYQKKTKNFKNSSSYGRPQNDVFFRAFFQHFFDP